MTSRDAVLLAVSADTVESHCAFAEQLGAPFRLLADPGLDAVAAYGVELKIRDMTIAKRATFVIDPDGKIAWLDRDFPVPQTLAGSDLVAALDGVLAKRIEAAVAKEKDETAKALKLLFLRAVAALAAEDAKALRPLLLETGDGETDAAKAMIADFRTGEGPRPSVFDLVDPAKIEIAADKEGLFDVSAKTGRDAPSRISLAVKRTDDGYRVRALRTSTSK